MKHNRIIMRKILSILICFALLLPSLPLTMIVSSVDYIYTGGAGNRISDLDTSLKFSESLGDNASTEYAGRIWTDKSVYTGNATFGVFGGGTLTIMLNDNKKGEDFLIAYSLLATAESISSTTQAPVDVVFILDLSGSMSDGSSNMDNGKSRIYNTVQAVNDAIDKVMSLNPNSRVAVVGFSSTAQVLLPLDRYTKLTGTENGDWVQTGSRPGQGYYEQVEVTYPYFSLSRETGSSDHANLYTRAVDSSENNINTTTSVSGGTNIQVGLYESMELLSEQVDTSINVNGSNVKRAPSVILLSDGAPTYSSSSSSWWAPANNNNDGAGSNPDDDDYFIGNGFKALLTAAYMKQQIDEHYGIDLTIYSIGMGITELTDAEQQLAYATLNPYVAWNDSDNAPAQDMKTAWETYKSNNNKGTPSINVGARWLLGYVDDYYTVTHPTSNDISGDALTDLISAYYDADNASSVTTVFEEIVANIAISAPKVPTEIRGTDHTTDGYITYTDPIGAYMEVKDVKAIIYAGRTFTAKQVSTSGNSVTYTFSGTIDSPVYGDQDISKILIEVTETNGKQTIVIKVPASAIPIRVNEVVLNPDGSVKTHTNNGAFPARIIYSVGLQSEVTKVADDGTVYIDKTAISDEYLAANTNSDGTINFYSNEYTNMHQINGSTVGDTMVEFEPSHDNAFYYILEDMPIYKDSALTQQLTALEGIDDNTVYYYNHDYYHGNLVETRAVERTGAQLKRTEIKTGDDGFLYRAEGSPRLNYILKFEGTKLYNNTNTAEDFYAPEFHYAEGSTSAYDGKFIVHLGNNGMLTAAAGGNLQITKTVSENKVTAPDKVFEFNVDIPYGDNEYSYVIKDASGSQVGTGTVSENNSKINLKDGQTATIFSLPPDIDYTVTETAESGFSAVSSGATGTIVAGQTSVVGYTNTYSVEPVIWPTDDVLEVTKKLDGREWSANDSFTFMISPYNNAPYPTNYNRQTGVVITGPDVAGGDSATFNFGSIKFETPGFYRYTIYEKEPENFEYLPGISYSRALYRLAVTVADDGEGQLYVASYDLQRLYNDNAEQLFTYGDNNEIIMNIGEEAQDEIIFVNTYRTESVTRVPVALKEYTDNSGKNPLVSGMFEFELKALGYLDENGALVEDVSKVPMPEGHVNGVISTVNEGRNVTFPAVTFKQEHILEGDTITFRYQMREVVPASPVNGMTYDDTKFVVDVVVSKNPNSAVLEVSPIYPNDERIATFKNTYTPESVKADIDGTKTLNGRDMLDGESFEFILSSVTSSENVVIPSTSATVSDAKNGIASSFSFKDIEFKKPGTYVFTVSETIGTIPGIAYDDSVITVTVVIADEEMDGKLEVVSVTYSDGADAAEFTNTYSSEFSGNPINLFGSKVLSGKTLLAGEFYFDIIEYYNGVAVGNRYVTHSEDLIGNNGKYTGNIVFIDRATYDKAGTYEYYITETIPNNKVVGTTYDESEYRYTVVVEDDLAGKLVVTSTKLEKANGQSWENATSIVFSNSYQPNSTTAVLPLINKVINGDRSDPLKKGEFEFVIKVYSAEPSTGITLPTTTVVSNEANGNVVFDEITFTKAGTYVISVEEIIPDEADKVPGITYSEQVIYAVYNVVDDRNGALTATLAQLIGGDSIINGYEASPAEVTIDIKKDFTGRKDDEWLSSDKFDFEVKVEDEATLGAIVNGNVEFTFDGDDTNVATYTISAKGDKAAVNIKINKPGTYKFLISEVDGGITGVTYDDSVKEITIVATDDSENAKIKVQINGEDTNETSVEFVNEYQPSETDLVNVTAKKTVTPSHGNSYTLVGGEFSFVIEAADGVPMPENTTSKNDANGDVNFGTISFAERGTYVYTIREEQATLGGFTYDSEIYTMTVEVTDDYANGKLVATVKITDSEGADAELLFDNIYNPDETSAVIFGVKELEGDHKDLEADEFEFVISAVTQDAPMPENTTVKNTATGAFQFGAITFTKVGVYTYEITERDLEKNGYSYDETIYTVTVTVTDTNGQLQASVEGVGTISEPTIKFVNKYVPNSVDIELGVNGELYKEIDGRELNEEEFTFAVLDGERNEITAAKNALDGTFKFTLSFTKAGTYNYTIVEYTGQLPGIIYDETIYGLEIVVIDDNGELKVESVEYSLGDDKVDEVVFNNTYNPDAAGIIISAIKDLTGRDLEADEFEFVVKDERDEVVKTATNGEDGSVVFENIILTEVGTYVFTVSETVGTLANVTYDGTVYTVKVDVTDNGEGCLVASTPVITKAGSDEPVSEIVFENTYTAPLIPNPSTGDNTLGLFLALFLVSIGGAFGFTVYNKKRIAK